MIKIYEFRIYDSKYAEDGEKYIVGFENTATVLKYLNDCRREGEKVVVVDCVCVFLTEKEEKEFYGEGFYSMDFEKMMDDYFSTLYNRVK